MASHSPRPVPAPQITAAGSRGEEARVTACSPSRRATGTGRARRRPARPAVSSRSRAPGTARRSGPGRQTSLETICGPSASTISRTEDTTRTPPVLHARWTTKWIAEATSSPVASTFSRSGLCAAYAASFVNTPREDEECTVAMEPSLPWLITFSIAISSGPRISPTITRAGFIRRPQRTSSARPISPVPSMLASRACMATTFGCRAGSASRPSSKVSSMVTSRSCGGISAARARSRVVLPMLVPPATRMFLRARTAADKNPAIAWSTVPSRARASRVTRAWRWRRTEMHGRRVTDMTANSRDPSGSWMVSRGLARSNRRSSVPARAAMVRISSTRSASEAATGAARAMRPSAYPANTWSCPLTSMFSTCGSSSSACRPPRPSSAAVTARVTRFSAAASRAGCPDRSAAVACSSRAWLIRADTTACRSPGGSAPWPVSSRSWAWRASAAATWARSWPVTACSSGPPVTAPAPGQGIAAGASCLVLTGAP